VRADKVEESLLIRGAPFALVYPFIPKEYSLSAS
jgi:hypothetical protein